MDDLNNDKNKLIGDLSDDEYERQLYAEKKRSREDRERAEQARLKAQKEAEARYQKQLAQERVELMKLKSGVIEEPETLKEVHEEKRKLTFWQKIGNIWYHFKFRIIATVVALAVVSFLMYDTFTRVDPDLTVIVLCSNAITMRLDEVQEYFEQFTDDFNDDGKVYVRIFSIPINPDGTNYDIMIANQSKLMTEFQSGKDVLVIADPQSEADIEPTSTLQDLRGIFKGVERATVKGYELTSEKLKTAWQWEEMPSDMYLGIRVPVQTMMDSKETMQESYDQAMIVLERVIADLEAK